MHPRTAELFGYLDEQQATLRDAFDAVPTDRRDMRPTPETWSPADIVAHVAIIERRVTGVVAKLVAEAAARGTPAGSNTSPILPTIDVSPMLDRTIKIKAPAPIDPLHSTERFGWSDFERARSDLKSALAQGDDWALDDLTQPHPIFGPLDTYAWVVFVAAHCARHAAQIREIDAAMRTS